MTTNKNGIEFDIDDIITDLNGKMDRDGVNATASVCVETYQNGASWYRVYSDGWCEQGGLVAAPSSTRGTINFVKTFADNNYIVLTNAWKTNNYAYEAAITAKTVSSCNYWIDETTGYARGGIMWQACGYIR